MPVISTTRFDTRVIPDSFMNTDEVVMDIDRLIAQLAQTDEQQRSIDSVYGGFCDIVKREMDTHLPQRRVTLSSGVSNRKRREIGSGFVLA